MNNLERQLLQRTYIYDDGTYILVIDILEPDAAATLSYEEGHLKATIRTHSDYLGDLSIPIRHRIEDDPTYYHNNGIITLEGKLQEEPDNEIDNGTLPDDEESDSEDEE